MPLGVFKHKLLNDVETRWNSTYDMIVRALEQQAPICATLAEHKRMDLLLKDNEVKLIEEAASILKPFKDVIEQMSGQKYVTVSAIRPILHHLLNNILNQKNSDLPAIDKMKSEMRKKPTAKVSI